MKAIAAKILEYAERYEGWVGIYEESYPEPAKVVDVTLGSNAGLVALLRITYKVSEGYGSLGPYYRPDSLADSGVLLHVHLAPGEEVKGAYDALLELHRWLLEHMPWD